MNTLKMGNRHTGHRSDNPPTDDESSEFSQPAPSQAACEYDQATSETLLSTEALNEKAAAGWLVAHFHQVVIGETSGKPDRSYVYLFVRKVK